MLSPGRGAPEVRSRRHHGKNAVGIPYLLTAQVAQEDDPDFLYKAWFFGTPEIVAEKIYRMTQYAGRHLLKLHLQSGPDPAREDHALHGAVCHEGHAALPRLYARPGKIPAQGQRP